MDVSWWIYLWSIERKLNIKVDESFKQLVGIIVSELNNKNIDPKDFTIGFDSIIKELNI